MKRFLLAGLLGLALILSACGQPPATIQSIAPRPSVTGIQLKGTAAASPEGPPSTPFDTPTPDPTRVVDDAGTELYIVQDGDTFIGIASELTDTWAAPNSRSRSNTSRLNQVGWRNSIAAG